MWLSAFVYVFRWCHWEMVREGGGNLPVPGVDGSKSLLLGGARRCHCHCHHIVVIVIVLLSLHADGKGESCMVRGECGNGQRWLRFTIERGMVME